MIIAKCETDDHHLIKESDEVGESEIINLFGNKWEDVYK